jgi:hypothetical protein
MNAVQEGTQASRHLMTAILDDAVHCYRTHWASRDRRGRQLFRAAESWIMDPYPHGTYSFARVCELLGVPGEALRRDLRRWVEHQRAERWASPAGAHAA